MAYSLEDKRRYAQWLATPDGVRRRSGLPLSKAAYAQAHGLTDRTLRRWNADETVQRLVAEEQANWVEAPQAPAAAPAAASGAPRDLAAEDYVAIRGSLVDLARGGDQKALDTWMRYWGKAFVEEELAARQRGLASLDDDELVAEVLDLVGRERVESWLAAGV